MSSTVTFYGSSYTTAYNLTQESVYKELGAALMVFGFLALLIVLNYWLKSEVSSAPISSEIKSSS